MWLKTSDTVKLLHNQELQRYLKEPRSRAVELIEGTEESCNHSKTWKTLATRLCNHSKTWKTLATRLGQEITPDWDKSGVHRGKKLIAGWPFNKRKSDLGIRPCRHAEGDLLETLVALFYTMTFVTIPPTRQLSYQICPEEGIQCTCRLREFSSMPRIVRHIDSPSCLSGWRGCQACKNSQQTCPNCV